jgi:hypothetical protein
MGLKSDSKDRRMKKTSSMLWEQQYIISHPKQTVFILKSLSHCNDEKVGRAFQQFVLFSMYDKGMKFYV